MKAYPGLLLILFIYRKKYREAIFCAVIAFIFTLAPLLLSQGGVLDNIIRLIMNIKLYMDNYAIGGSGLENGCSLLGLIKAFVYEFNLTKHYTRLVAGYSIAAAIIGMLICGYLLIKEMPLWKKAASLVIMMILLTPVSADYKLLHLFIPVYLFVNEKEKNKGDLLFTILYALLLIPKNLRFFHGLYGGVIIDPVIMCLFLILIICRFGEENGISVRKERIQAFVPE